MEWKCESGNSCEFTPTFLVYDSVMVLVIWSIASVDHLQLHFMRSRSGESCRPQGIAPVAATNRGYIVKVVLKPSCCTLGLGVNGSMRIINVSVLQDHRI